MVAVELLILFYCYHAVKQIVEEAAFIKDIVSTVENLHCILNIFLCFVRCF